jgi:hypothetical protein
MQSDPAATSGVPFRDSLFARGDSSANLVDRRGMARNTVPL